MIRSLFRIIVLLVGIGAALVLYDAYRFFTTPLTSGRSAVVQVDPGSSFRTISRKLFTRGIFTGPQQSHYFNLYARLRGVTQKVHSGEYEVLPGMTPPVLLRAMVTGDTRQYRFTIVEGWTFAQLRAAMTKHAEMKQSLQHKTAGEVMAALGYAGEHAEGRFLPDTYKFPRGTTDIAFLQRAYRSMQRVLDAEWDDRAQELPLKSAYQALILASIVEKETAVADERSRIAGVFLRRLKFGMPLQTDPTVIYGIANFDGNIRRKDLTRDGPYNTYLRPGLPPTPIALPGRAAIHASLHPSAGDALYFVAKGDGTHAFSPSLEQHEQAVRKYQLKHAR